LTGIGLALPACGGADGTSEAVAEERPTATASVSGGEDDLAQEGPGRGMAWVVLGSDTVFAEVAATAEERRDGLMYREDLPEGTGMLFVFPDEAMRSFWMSNTYLPLDIAFISSNNRVVDIKQMEPEDTDLTDSDAPAMYALEVIQGWFEAQGIEVGTEAQIIFGPR
jgi:uncharacterized membrane protein (UPF0127 family)